MHPNWKKEACYPEHGNLSRSMPLSRLKFISQLSHESDKQITSQLWHIWPPFSNLKIALKLFPLLNSTGETWSSLCRRFVSSYTSPGRWPCSRAHTRSSWQMRRCRQKGRCQGNGHRSNWTSWISCNIGRGSKVVWQRTASGRACRIGSSS